MAQLMGKENGYALVRLPSGEMRRIPVNCMATIGQVSNIDHNNVNYGKAGRKRHMGIRPTVRGSVMNPLTVVVKVSRQSDVRDRFLLGVNQLSDTRPVRSITALISLS